MSRTFLITGGAGFIGSHLADVLLNSGNHVVVIDDFNDYYSPQIKEANLKFALNHPQFSLIRGDIRDVTLLAAVFSKQPINTVIHLAARAGVRPSLEQPELYWDVNVMGTLKLLEHMKAFHVNRLIFASSSSVYGDRDAGPFAENDNTDRQVSPYGASKKSGELLVHTYAHLYGIKSTCLRFFTAFGPRNRPDMACYKFVDAIATNKPLVMYGDGTTGRDYTYINDLISGIIASLNQKTNYEIYNLGNSHPVLLTDMIATIETIVNKKALIKKLPLQPGDVTLTFADISKAQKDLGFHPTTDFKTGIKKLYQWYKS